MRHKRVSCSPSNLAALAIGIALANVSTKASNNSVKPDPARAQGVATLRTPQFGQLTRHTRVQQRAMLEEIQMPPRFILRVVNRATLAPALGAGEPAPARKIHIQIEPTILDRKFATRHRPRRLQPKGQLEKIGVSHPLTVNSIPTDRSPSQPRKTALPTPFSEEPAKLEQNPIILY